MAFEDSIRPLSDRALGDDVGDRRELLRVGMIAVFIACVVFAVARLATTLTSGAPTPWWANALGAGAIALIFGWYRRKPPARTTGAAHATALVAVLALLAPLAYGMESTLWWLSLVGFAMALMGTPREALVWALGVPTLVAAITLGGPWPTVPGAAGESPLEQTLARIVFALLVVGLAIGFRRSASQRARALAGTAAALEKAHAARGRFLAHVSHEIRTPLHNVISMTDLALSAPLPDEARQQVRAAKQSARVLLGLLNNILDVTRAEAGGLELAQEPFSLHAALGEVARPFAAEARTRGLAFSASAEPDLAEWRLGDEHRVKQIVLNLIENALKFTDRGEIRVRLTAVAGVSDRVLLRVSDSGRGMSGDQLPRIFEPFAQADAADARRQGGAGLGLAIVRELVAGMGGAVEVESELGRGSRFSVDLRLPADPSRRGAGPIDLLAGSLATPAPVPLTTSTTGLDTLVCEDDPGNLAVLAAMLRYLGHRAELTTSGEAAWQRLEERPFDLLLTDIEMPGISGLELARRIRRREQSLALPRLPIIGCTAHVGAEDRDRLIQAGIDRHLPKPFDLAELSRTLGEVATPNRTGAEAEVEEVARR